MNVRDGGLLWSGKFDEKFTDIFSIQDTISEQVAQALAPGLTGEEKTLLAKRYTTNADAHYAYVRGRIFWNRRTADDLKTAIKYFNDAIEKDPNYALAYAGLADAYSLLADYGGTLPDEAYPNAAMKALALDDGGGAYIARLR
ncbi:MAG: tetratricopeptide repeat protein [Pyrinomonadaceae bacterium]